MVKTPHAVATPFLPGTEATRGRYDRRSLQTPRQPERRRRCSGASRARRSRRPSRYPALPPARRHERPRRGGRSRRRRCRCRCGETSSPRASRNANGTEPMQYAITMIRTIPFTRISDFQAGRTPEELRQHQAQHVQRGLRGLKLDHFPQPRRTETCARARPRPRAPQSPRFQPAFRACRRPVRRCRSRRCRCPPRRWRECLRPSRAPPVR